MYDMLSSWQLEGREVMRGWEREKDRGVEHVLKDQIYSPSLLILEGPDMSIGT